MERQYYFTYVPLGGRDPLPLVPGIIGGTLPPFISPVELLADLPELGPPGVVPEAFPFQPAPELLFAPPGVLLGGILKDGGGADDGVESKGGGLLPVVDLSFSPPEAPPAELFPGTPIFDPPVGRSAFRDLSNPAGVGLALLPPPDCGLLMGPFLPRLLLFAPELSILLFERSSCGCDC